MPDLPIPNPDEPDVVGDIRARLARQLGCRPDQVDLDLRLTDLPGVDSAKLIEIIAACERRWLVQLDEEQLFDVRTGADLCALIKGQLRDGAA